MWWQENSPYNAVRIGKRIIVSSVFSLLPLHFRFIAIRCFSSKIVWPFGYDSRTYRPNSIRNANIIVKTKNKSSKTKKHYHRGVRGSSLSFTEQTRCREYPKLFRVKCVWTIENGCYFALTEKVIRVRTKYFHLFHLHTFSQRISDVHAVL